MEQDITLTIADGTQRSMPDTGEQKPCISFVEDAKLLVLNKTNACILEASFDEESDAWKGKKVVLWRDDDVVLQGKVAGLELARCEQAPPRKSAFPLTRSLMLH